MGAKSFEKKAGNVLPLECGKQKLGRLRKAMVKG